MFDIGWSEMAVIALIALIVIGPKELPNAMRAAAKWARKARGLAREFQSGIDDMIREADLEDARKAIGSARDMNIDRAVEDTLDPGGDLRSDARDLEDTARRQPDSKDSAGTSAKQPDTAPPTQADKADAGGASIVSHPAKVAPPHSLPAKGEGSAPTSAQPAAASSDPAPDPGDSGHKRA